MGAQPGDCIDANTFTLPSHDGLTAEQSAERIAMHFASISQEYPPLDVSTLPSRVQTKLQCTDGPPIINEHDVYAKIKAAKKPRSGVPNDLPKVVTQEFAPELAKPVSRIVSNITETGEWPNNGNWSALYQ